MSYPDNFNGAACDAQWGEGSQEESDLVNTITRAGFELKELVTQIVAIAEKAKSAADELEAMGADSLDIVECYWEFGNHPEDMIDAFDDIFESAEDARVRRNEQNQLLRAKWRAQLDNPENTACEAEVAA